MAAVSILLASTGSCAGQHHGRGKPRPKPDTVYYDLLGVKRDATDREMRRQFKKLALKHHPDRNTGDPTAHDTFVEINTAYEVLKDPEMRKKYDKLGKEGLEDMQKKGDQYQDSSYYEREFGLYDEDEQVETFNSGTFWEMFRSDETWLVNFYSPGCSHCHDLAPTWRDFAKAMEGGIGVGAVNCQDAWDVCQNMGVRSYPTIIKFVEGETYHHHQGSRDMESLVEFGLGGFAMPSALSQHTFDRLQTQDMPSVIIVCDTRVYDCETPTELQKMSAVLHGIVNVFTLECQWERDLCDAHGLDRPQALYVEKGKPVNKFFPAADAAGEAQDWAESYDAVKLGHAVIGLLPLPPSINSEEFAAKVGTGAVTKEARGNTNEVAWSTISTTAACENNREGITRVSFYESAQTLEVCQTMCQDRHDCMAIDYYAESGWCNLYDDVCTSPMRSEQGSSSYALKRGNGVAAILVFFVNFAEAASNEAMAELERQIRQLPRLKKGIEKYIVECDVHPHLCQSQGVAVPETVLYKEMGHEAYHGEAKAELLVDFAHKSASTRLVALDPSHFPHILDEPVAWFIDFYANWCPPCKRMLPHFRKASVEVSDPSIRFGSVDCAKFGDLCSKMGIESYPQPVFYSAKDNTPHFFQGDFTSVSDFLQHIQDVLEPPMEALDAQTFEATLKPSKALWLVVFSAGPWCGPCTQMKGVMKDVARSTRGIVRVGYINCDEQGDFCGQQGVNSYPNLRRYPAKTGDQKLRKFSVFQGNRWPDFIIQWAMQGLPNKVVHMTADQFKAEGVGVSAAVAWMVTYSCPRWCGPCKNFQPKQKQMAYALQKDLVKVAHIDCDDNRDFCNNQGIQAYPTVFLYITGQQREQLEIDSAASMIELLRAKAPEPKLDQQFITNLLEFYASHKVTKTQEDVEQLAVKYVGREDTLLDKLAEKYGERPLMPHRDEL